MCCVRFGWRAELLLPADKAMKLVELLQQAALCERNYDGAGYVFVVQEQPEVELITVKASQIRMPQPSPASVSSQVLRLTDQTFEG
ncbi:MAG: hypothetical protein AB7P99_13125 [Vicinamibacterales bacterium]|uniref:hypothetical protein n=1 Tax=Ramlibacter sp. TaxID=1917967 RepID=UPI003D0A2440